MEFISYLVGAPASSKRWLGGDVYSVRSAMHVRREPAAGMLVGSLVKLLVGEKSSFWAGDVDFRYPRTTYG